MTIIHVCDGWEPWNGAAKVARLLAKEQTDAGHDVCQGRWVSARALRAADEIWVHCAWKPCLWWAALWGRNVKWMPAGSYDPLRLRFHAWKKWPIGFIERFFLRRCRSIVATSLAEADWIRAYLGCTCSEIVVEDLKRFFRLDDSVGKALQTSPRPCARPLRVLYLGRRHPLKGLEYLERAVAEINARHVEVDLRVVSNHQGAQLEGDWNWCDVLCLPTLSENFGLVIAEALERGISILTTDGAPAWATEIPASRYLRGYRNGTDTERVRRLRDALYGIMVGK